MGVMVDLILLVWWVRMVVVRVVVVVVVVNAPRARRRVVNQDLLCFRLFLSAFLCCSWFMMRMLSVVISIRSVRARMRDVRAVSCICLLVGSLGFGFEAGGVGVSGGGFDALN